MKKRNAVLAFVLLAAAWTAACIPTIQRPDVQLVGVRLGGLGLQGGLLYVQLGIANPNGFALKADGFTYKIELREPGEQGEAWTNFVDGVFSNEVQVAAHDSTVVEIPVEFRYSGFGSAIRSLLDSGTFNYRVSGTVAVEKPIRTDLPYRHTGTASLARFD
jgi:LEA14-like dessication related protein